MGNLILSALRAAGMKWSYYVRQNGQTIWFAFDKQGIIAEHEDRSILNAYLVFNYCPLNN